MKGSDQEGATGMGDRPRTDDGKRIIAGGDVRISAVGLPAEALHAHAVSMKQRNS